jgi:phage tail sheath protein FI
MAAFVGFAPGGPVNEPVLITNWSQYVDTFGVAENGGKRNPHMKGTYLSHSVYGYFLNGGGRCYVTRLGTGKSSKPKEELPTLQIPSKASKAMPSITLQAKELSSGDIEVEVKPATSEPPPDGTFTLRFKTGTTEELHENVTLGRGKKNVVETVTQSSRLVAVLEVQTAGSLADRMPEIGTYTLKAVSLVKSTQQEGLPAVQAKNFGGDVTDRSGIAGFEIAEDATMLCCPDLMSAYEAGLIDRAGVKAVQTAMIDHCEKMGDRMAILDPLPGLSSQDVKTWRMQETNYDSKFAALYYPWIKVAGGNGHPIAVPPSGHIAGVYARNDKERGVHKAPANEIVRGALEPASAITKGEQDTLNPIGVNCIRSFSGQGIRVWGARTLSSDPAWRYINVRRLFNFVEKSIERGTQWVVFEPNDSDLWARVRRDVGAFLTGVWRAGALFGITGGEAFFVKCDEEINPPDVRDRGQLIIEIGLAPVKPAEFVIFRLSQFAGGGA